MRVLRDYISIIYVAISNIYLACLQTQNIDLNVSYTDILVCGLLKKGGWRYLVLIGLLHMDV